MVSFGWELFLLCLTAAVLTFFIARLLFICLEHVDNLGAYTASRPETCLLIPSVLAVSGNRYFLGVEYCVDNLYNVASQPRRTPPLPYVKDSRIRAIPLSSHSRF